MQVQVEADVVEAVETVGMGWDGLGWVGMGWDGLDGLTRMDDSDDSPISESKVVGRGALHPLRRAEAERHNSYVSRIRKDGSQRA